MRAKDFATFRQRVQDSPALHIELRPEHPPARVIVLCMVFALAMTLTLALFALSGWLEWRAITNIARMLQEWFQGAPPLE